MSRLACYLLLGLAIPLAAACQSPDPDDGAPDAAATSPDTGHAASEDDPIRDGLPLRPIMQQLGADMAGLMHAMWLEEYEQMAAYAGDIVNHPSISPEELQRIKAELGQEMNRFVAADEAVHDAAVRLRDAIEARDLDAILQRLNEVQAGCMSCHTRFRERLRTAPSTP